VTEFGAAHIFGRNLRERCEALINIAHPKFKDELTAQAKERKLIV
jgi:acyl-CoA hydrolase